MLNLLTIIRNNPDITEKNVPISKPKIMLHRESTIVTIYKLFSESFFVWLCSLYIVFRSWVQIQIALDKWFLTFSYPSSLFRYLHKLAIPIFKFVNRAELMQHSHCHEFTIRRSCRNNQTMVTMPDHQSVGFCLLLNINIAFSCL